MMDLKLVVLFLVKKYPIHNYNYIYIYVLLLLVRRYYLPILFILILPLISGFALSPVILDNFGPLTNYGLNIGCFVIAILYTIIFIPHQPSATKKATKNLIKDMLISPVSNMIKCLFKRREGGIHWLIAIQIYLLSTYWFALYEIADMRYLGTKTYL